MKVAPTWRHDERQHYPGLHDQPTIEALFESVACSDRIVDRVTVVDGDERLTGGELTDRCRRLAGGLRRLGVTRGDVVSFQTPSWWETIALYRACWRLGAIAAPIHHLAGESDVAVMVDQVSPLMTVASVGSPMSKVAGCIEVRGDGGFESLLDEAPVVDVEAEPADVAVVLFTSGSTGGPKGVMHTHRALAYKARSLLRVHGIGAEDVVLMPA